MKPNDKCLWCGKALNRCLGDCDLEDLNSVVESYAIRKFNRVLSKEALKETVKYILGKIGINSRDKILKFKYQKLLNPSKN